MAIISHSVLSDNILTRTSKRFHKLLVELPPLTIPFSVYTHEFTLFPKLPEDLRRRIWSFVASERRYIKLIELDSCTPPSFQTWESRVANQSQHPAMISICKESRDIASKWYRRCFQKVQRSSETGAKKWSGSTQELQQAKLDSIISTGNVLYVNFFRDIFLLSKHPAIQHEQKKVGLGDYNLKPFQLRFIQRIQQVYSEKRGCRFPLALFLKANIRDYGLEMDAVSKEMQEGLGAVCADDIRRTFRFFLMRALLLCLGDKKLNVPLVEWEVELR